MYKSTNIIVKKNQKELYDYCKYNCELAKLFKNVVIYTIRQIFTAKEKGFDYNKLFDNEKEILNNFKLTEDKYKPISDKYYLPSFYHLDYYFKITKNVDYYNDLPSQSTQQIIKEVIQDFKGFFGSIKSYKVNKTNFTGRPKLPKYIKTEQISYDITNQDAVIYCEKDKTVLKLPKIKQRVKLGKLKLGKLQEITITPYYDTYKIVLTTLEEDIVNKELDKNRVMGLDLGVNNLVSTNNNCGLTPFIINGKNIKSINQWYNKKISYLQSLLSQEQHTSKQIQQLWKKRNNVLRDVYNKTASYIIKYAVENNIGLIVVGKNKQWKNKIDIGKVNNQNFAYISHAELINKIQQLGKKYGVEIVIQEESYTSKASLLHKDFIPTYSQETEENDSNHKFSGIRRKRGLYVAKFPKSKLSKKKTVEILLNADVNAAGNIIRKYKPILFDNFNSYTEFEYMYKTVNKINIQ